MKGGETLEKGGLTAREKRFCTIFSGTGNAKEAAAAAGFGHPEQKGTALLLRDDIRAEIDRIYAATTLNCRQRARAGYERLAFGSIKDAVRLMFEPELNDRMLEEYDLYNVSEIKRPKDGAMEIKFFDRIKALEKLEGTAEPEENRVSEFYGALVRSVSEGADKLSEEKEEYGEE